MRTVISVSVLPASAGMIRPDAVPEAWSWSAPRICGDDPSVGALIEGAIQLVNALVLPASSGMILHLCLWVGLPVGAPRIRGDDPLPSDQSSGLPRCSLHPRG